MTKLVKYARANAGHDYPGAELSLSTWRAQDDARWFGANIPGSLQSVEFVNVTAGPDKRPSYSYEGDQGTPLVKTPEAGGRASLILSQRAAVMP